MTDMTEAFGAREMFDPLENRAADVLSTKLRQGVHALHFGDAVLMPLERAHGDGAPARITRNEERGRGFGDLLRGHLEAELGRRQRAEMGV